MECVVDEPAVVGQRTDHRVLAHEGHHLLLRGVPVDQGADRPQAVRAVARRDPARPLDRGGGVPLGQAQQADQDPDRLDAPRLDHRLGPAGALRPEPTDPGQVPGRAPLDPADLLRGDVHRLRAEPPRLVPDVHRDLLHPVVEDPHHPRVPADPDPAGEVLRRHRVVGVLDLDVAVAVDRAAGLAERRERVRRQRQQRRPFDLSEVFADVSTCGPVHAGVGHGQLPVAEEPVLLLQAGEAPAPQGVLLDVVDAPLDLPLVAGRVGARRQEHGAVVLAEGADLGVDLGVEPVGLLHGGLEVVQDHAAWGTPPKCRKASSRQRRKSSVVWR